MGLEKKATTVARLTGRQPASLAVMSPETSQWDEGSEDGFCAVCGTHANGVLCTLCEQDMEEEGRFLQEYEQQIRDRPEEDEAGDGREVASKHISSHGSQCRASPRKRANNQ